MLKKVFHPNAYLTTIKNVKRGLRARTRILYVLEKKSADARTTAKEAGLSYGAVLHHLRLLMMEDIVDRKGGRPYIWTLTGVGQKRLAN
jgi:predicted ArsR family transcriptional regulator